MVIVGDGMGACRLLDELVRREATNRFEITVFGEERGGAYNRILLGKVLAGGAPDAIVTNDGLGSRLRFWRTCCVGRSRTSVTAVPSSTLG
jgi:hypothetical protein